MGYSPATNIDTNRSQTEPKGLDCNTPSQKNSSTFAFGMFKCYKVTFYYIETKGKLNTTAGNKLLWVYNKVQVMTSKVCSQNQNNTAV